MTALAHEQALALADRVDRQPPAWSSSRRSRARRKTARPMANCKVIELNRDMIAVFPTDVRE